MGRLKQLISLLCENKFCKMAMLALHPFYSMPSHYLNRKFYTQFLGLTVPLIPAAVWANGNMTFLDFTLHLREARTNQVLPTDIWRQLYTFKSYAFPIEIMAVVFIIYFFSIYQFCFHFGATSIAKRFVPDIKNPPFLYFLGRATAFAFWFSVFGYLIVKIYIASDGDIGSYINRIESGHPWLVLALILGFGAANKIIGIVRNKGMLELYGGSRKILLFVDIIGIAFLISLFWIYSKCFMY